MVFYDYVVDDVIIDSLIPYSDVLTRTGLRDQVGLTELGYIEHMEEPILPEITPEQIAMFIKGIQLSKLASSDWTQMPDVQLSETKKLEWINYRQELRDMPETFNDVDAISDVIVPTMPTK